MITFKLRSEMGKIYVDISVGQRKKLESLTSQTLIGYRETHVELGLSQGPSHSGTSILSC